MPITTDESLTFDELEKRHIGPLAAQLAARYRPWNVGYQDIRSEMVVFCEGRGKRRIEKWLASDPQEAGRIYRALDGVARVYCEREKARTCGYSVDDVTWYSQRVVESLLSIAFETNFDGTGSPDLEDASSSDGRSKTPSNEGNNLLCQVLDIRRALLNIPAWATDVLYAGRDNHLGWQAALQCVVDELGGDRPYDEWRGRRPAMSNAAAQAVTGGSYGG